MGSLCRGPSARCLPPFSTDICPLGPLPLPHPKPHSQASSVKARHTTGTGWEFCLSDNKWCDSGPDPVTDTQRPARPQTAGVGSQARVGGQVTVAEGTHRPWGGTRVPRCAAWASRPPTQGDGPREGPRGRLRASGRNPASCQAPPGSPPQAGSGQRVLTSPRQRWESVSPRTLSRRTSHGRKHAGNAGVSQAGDRAGVSGDQDASGWRAIPVLTL